MRNNIVNDFRVNGIIPNFPEQGTAYYFDNASIPYAYYRLLPGHIYTYVSSKNVEEDSIPTLDEYQTSPNKSIKPYFDKRPIILSLGQEGPMEVGLNLKVMPATLRKWFLMKYYNIIKPVIDQSADENGKFKPLADRFKLPSLPMLQAINRDFITKVGEQTNINFKFLVDKYTRGEMSTKLAMIDWDEAIKLPLLSYMNDGSVVSKTPILYFLTKFT